MTKNKTAMGIIGAVVVISLLIITQDVRRSGSSSLQNVVKYQPSPLRSTNRYKEYTNSKFGFKFFYPDQYQVINDRQSSWNFQLATGKNEDPVVTATVEEIAGEMNLNGYYENKYAYELEGKKLRSRRFNFVNPKGIGGVEIYLDLNKEIWGPVYILDIYKETENKHVVVTVQATNSAGEQEKIIMECVVNTLEMI
jgi:hypothetical protein